MTIRGLREDEVEEHAELVYVSYSHGRELEPGSMLTHRDWWLQSIHRDPYYEPEQTRVAVEDGRLIASVTCYHRPTYIAGRMAHAGCIGSVCTHPDYRREGHAREVLAEAIAWMTERGWEWSFLYGREEIYGGSGYENLAGWSLTADLRPREEYAAGLSERPVDPDADVPTLTHIYEQFSGEMTGPTVRSEQYWRRRVLSARPWSDAPDYRLVLRDDEPIGYLHMVGAAVREIAWLGRPHEMLAHALTRAGDEPLRLGMFIPEMIVALREVSRVPGQQECFDDPGGVTLSDSYQGLWRLHHVSAVPRITSDTSSLIRILRDLDYVMWPADRA